MTEQGPPAWFRDAISVLPDERTVRVKGCDIHYLCWGDPGRPGLILVHGGAAHAQWWGFIGPLLAAQHHVVAVDLRATGQRPAPSTPSRPGSTRSWPAPRTAACAPARRRRPLDGRLVTIAAGNLYGEKLTGAIVIDSPVHRPDPSQRRACGADVQQPKTYATFERRCSTSTCSRRSPREPVHHRLHRPALATEAPDGGRGVRSQGVPAEPAGIADYLAEVHCRIAVFKGQHSDLVTADVQDYIDEPSAGAPDRGDPGGVPPRPLDQPLALVAAIRTILADGSLHPEARAG
jgi:pimeloyl-ACP methyl ester carboxylesterase